MKHNEYHEHNYRSKYQQESTPDTGYRRCQFSLKEVPTKGREEDAMVEFMVSGMVSGS
jgi:hypothetical protein